MNNYVCQVNVEVVYSIKAFAYRSCVKLCCGYDYEILLNDLLNLCL